MSAGRGLVMPGSEYIGVVEKMRQFLHLGEDEHIRRLQDMLEIVALTHEHDPRMDPSDKPSGPINRHGVAEVGDKV